MQVTLRPEKCKQMLAKKGKIINKYSGQVGKKSSGIQVSTQHKRTRFKHQHTPTIIRYPAGRVAGQDTKCNTVNLLTMNDSNRRLDAGQKEPVSMLLCWMEHKGSTGLMGLNTTIFWLYDLILCPTWMVSGDQNLFWERLQWLHSYVSGRNTEPTFTQRSIRKLGEDLKVLKNLRVGIDYDIVQKNI